MPQNEAFAFAGLAAAAAFVSWRARARRSAQRAADAASQPPDFADDHAPSTRKIGLGGHGDTAWLRDVEPDALSDDSAGEAAEVTGASIYTLSNQASSEAAARFAERENASDRLNGVDVGGRSDVVNTILVELSQRRTQEQSDEFARLIRREGGDAIRFHPQARRSAALKVLRAPDVPSVLFESGFITNEADAQRLASPEGRARFAEVMARAIRIYFARQQES